MERIQEIVPAPKPAAGSGPPPDGTAPAVLRSAFEVTNLNVWYGLKAAVQDVTLNIPERTITAIIGPSGCGKSTFLRCLNRMHELVPKARMTGSILFFGRDLYAAQIDPAVVRRRIGMVFLRDRMEQSLRMAALWDEVKDDLNKPGVSLSGGQQQRLCIARAIATQPEVLLMDEPASALDPIATMKVEELIHQLSRDYTIVIVTHNMQQASRVSDKTAFFYLGKVVEFNDTDQLFTRPREKQTEDYISGRFG